MDRKLPKPQLINRRASYIRLKNDLSLKMKTWQLLERQPKQIL